MARALHPQGATHNILRDFELLVIPSVENLGGVLQWITFCLLLTFMPLCLYLLFLDQSGLPAAWDRGGVASIGQRRAW